MPRGYRCIVLAAVGWLVLAAAVSPDNGAQANQTQAAQNIQRSLATIANAQEQAAKPGEYQAPCADGEYDNKSDLCAQWYAARAARDAANWSYWAVFWTVVSILLSGGGLGALIYTLRQTERSLKEARRANRIALLEARRARREARKAEGDHARALEIADRNANSTAKLAEASEVTARLQLRAYLTIGKVRLRRSPEKDTENELSYSSRFWITNVGATPALNAKIRCERFSGPNPDPNPNWLNDRDWHPIPIITQKLSNWIDDLAHIKRQDIPKIKDGGVFSYLIIQVEYSDVFGISYLYSTVLAMDVEKCCWVALSTTEEQVPNQKP